MSTESQPQEWTQQNHHPSCSPHDRDLVWHCSQCWANESAEAWHNAALAAERKKVKALVDALEAAKAFMEYLRANTGFTDDWPIELKVDLDCAEHVNKLLNEFETKVYSALAKVKEGK